MHAARTLAPRRLEAWTDKVFPLLQALLRAGYFTFTVEGLEHLPQDLDGPPLLYVGNHAGWFSFDSFFFMMALFDHLPPARIPYAVVQDVLHKLPLLGQFFQELGSVPVSWLRDPASLPPEVLDLGIFPEGESGNCKPFWQAYQQRPWKTGFVRLALARQALVVPVAILGGEEAFPNLATLRLFKKLIGAEAPLPLAPVPLPARWKVIFHEPIDLNTLSVKDRHDPDQYRAIAATVRTRVQATLDRETAGRPLPRLAGALRNPVVRATGLLGRNQ